MLLVPVPESGMPGAPLSQFGSIGDIAPLPPPQGFVGGVNADVKYCMLPSCAMPDD